MSTKTEVNVNLAISGWSGVGASTLALILADTLKLRYLHIGGIFREVGKSLGFSDEGSARPKFDEYIEPIIGPTIEKYKEHLLLNESGYLIDSDLGTFELGKHPKIFSIFVLADLDRRLERVSVEKREDAESVLIQRDEILKQRYQELVGIDVFDREFINSKFNLVIDNSNLKIETEVQIVYERLQEYAGIKSEYDWDLLMSEIDERVEHSRRVGKSQMRKSLLEQGLLVDTNKSIQEIVRIFPEDVTNYPENVRKIFLSA